MKTHTVKSGESLSLIAKKYTGSVSGWKQLYQLNSGSIKDPNKIFPGQVLRLPENWGGGAISQPSILPIYKPGDAATPSIIPQPSTPIPGQPDPVYLTEEKSSVFPLVLAAVAAYFILG